MAFVDNKSAIALPRLAIAGSLCWACRSTDNFAANVIKPLHRCSACKRAVYCNAACQKRDWNGEHKSMCKALRRLNADPVLPEKPDWESFKRVLRLRMDLIDMKDRDGKDLPGQMNISKALQFQPYCENCFLTPSDNEDHEYRPFNPCQECRLAFFCSDKCLSSGFHEHRRKQCADFQEQGAFEIMEIGHQKRSGEVRLMLPTMRPRNTYKALSTAHSWRQYFQDISGNSLGQCITDDFGPADNDSECLHLGRVLKVAAQASSFILTVLAGLEAEIPDLATRKHLTIHVVGASNIEIEIQRMNEELLHLLPKLQDLIVGYIGPDFPSEGEGSNHLMDIECCPECTSSGRTRRIFVKRRLYHDVVHSQLLAQNPPDLLVAFNSGHAESETKSWAPMLKFILDSGVPAIFTTYNEYEAIQEEQVLDKMGAHFSKRRSKNPWGGVRPYFDTFMERYEKYYQNNYWYIVKGR